MVGFIIKTVTDNRKEDISTATMLVQRRHHRKKEHTVQTQRILLPSMTILVLRSTNEPNIST
jgi:hypothetical protein